MIKFLFHLLLVGILSVALTSACVDLYGEFSTTLLIIAFILLLSFIEAFRRAINVE